MNVMSAGKKMVREHFRESVFKRDRNACVMCGARNLPLDAHHITDRNLMPNGGYVKENGITLCDSATGCHNKAECYHRGEQVAPGFMPEELYKKIGSSYEKAVEASKKLK